MLIDHQHGHGSSHPDSAAVSLPGLPVLPGILPGSVSIPSPCRRPDTRKRRPVWAASSHASGPPSIRRATTGASMSGGSESWRDDAGGCHGCQSASGDEQWGSVPDCPDCPCDCPHVPDCPAESDRIVIQATILEYFYEFICQPFHAIGVYYITP